jgi:alcohol dehydrogenase, propanol-preferring
MRAVRLDAPGVPLRLVEVPVPEPAGTEVSIRVAACGVCRTDLHIADGTQPRVELPLILGHEVAGWIEAIGPDADGPLTSEGLAIGDAVVVFGGWGCGACRECRAGEEQRCPNGRSPGLQADGGYAERMLVPHARHLVAIGVLDPVAAAPLADAGLTSFRAVRRTERWLKTAERILVIGCGGLGQFALQHLRQRPRGRELFVAATDLSSRRLERAAALGADATVLDADAVSALDALHGPADVVLDFVGTDETLALAAGTIAPNGVVMLVGEAGGSMPFGFERPAVEAWLTTTSWGSVRELREVVRLARIGRLQIDVEAVDLADASAAHERVRSGAVSGRLVLVPEAAG